MNRYRDFFIESPEGQQFVKSLLALIDSNHEKGENEPELARDYMQRAKGIREVLAHIQVITAVSGKKRERLIEEAKQHNIA